MNGRVAVMRGYGEPITLEEFEVPDPEPGAVVVRVEQAGVCGSDLHVWRGDTSAETASPAQLGFGHEGFGRVVALGEGVSNDNAGRPVAIGDRVIHHVMADHCGRGPNPNLQRRYGEHPYFFTTFADYYYIGPTRPFYRVPDALADDVLPSVNSAMGAAISALGKGGVSFGSRVVIFGAGGLGLTAAAAARDMGAELVIVLDRLPARLELAELFGADATIDVSETPEERRVKTVRELTGGRGADVVLDLVGSAAILPEGVAMLGTGGSYVEAGLFYSGTSVAFDPSSILRGRRRIVGSAGYPAALLPAILAFLERNARTRPFERLISHRFPLAEVNEALERSDWSRGTPSVTRSALIP